MNGLNKHLGADGIRLHVQCWLTHANIQHFINKAIKTIVGLEMLKHRRKSATSGFPWQLNR